MRRHGSQDPHRHELKFSSIFPILWGGETSIPSQFEILASHNVIFKMIAGHQCLFKKFLYQCWIEFVLQLDFFFFKVSKVKASKLKRCVSELSIQIQDI